MEVTRSLGAYEVQPHLVREHANIEGDTAHGGYAGRQLFELIQNSADALLPIRRDEKPTQASSTAPPGRIAIHLTERHVYCADDGEPIDQDGVRALMFSHLSPKRDTGQIGTFGLGFKSVLGVSDAPEFFARSCSFRFDPDDTRERIRNVAPGTAPPYPVLRLPDPIDPREHAARDDVLHGLMDWASNIVRLPLKPDAYEHLRKQLSDFPPEFLLFVDHVRTLMLAGNSPGIDRTLELEELDGEFRLADGDSTRRWKRFNRTHELSASARADRRPGDERDEVPIFWAAPLDRLNEPGRFWAFFPTHTPSLVAGILNAPWKTNEDRQNLLPGPYNDELIEAAATMIAEEIAELSARNDPARHLDALPRRHEAGDSNQTNLLRDRLFYHLRHGDIVPDQDGTLRHREKIRYPPKELTGGRSVDLRPFERWAAHPGRPSGWLHHKALRRDRLAALNRLFPLDGYGGYLRRVPQTTVAEWLEALVRAGEPDDSIQAAMAAIQVAALLPDAVRTEADLGEIGLTARGTLRVLDPELLLLPPDDPIVDEGIEQTESYIHPELAADRDTRSALRALGLRPLSPEASFRLIARRLLGDHADPEPSNGLRALFWNHSRKLSPETACEIIRECEAPDLLRVSTRAGRWAPTCSVLLPGEIAPGDGTRDNIVTVDTCFHSRDTDLLAELGVSDGPRPGRAMFHEPEFVKYKHHQRALYLLHASSRPRKDYLDFAGRVPHRRGPAQWECPWPKPIATGPLQVLTLLSDEGRVLYTEALLQLPETYEPWTMWHKGTNRDSYSKRSCDSLSVHMLRERGRIRVDDRIVPMADALGREPTNPDALHALLVHPMAEQIKKAFDLSDPIPEFIGEEDPLPLTDAWPGLTEHLPPDHAGCRLVYCERILVAGGPRDGIFHAPDVYVARSVDNDGKLLQCVVDALQLNLGPDEVKAILGRRTPHEIADRRKRIQQECETDAERLLAAVREPALRKRLPNSLLAALESNGDGREGTHMAEAAIATWHTDALRQYRRELHHLGPPVQWAGSRRALDFVRSLGFGPDWAGERKKKRDPFVEIAGPHLLPRLHDYQQTVAEGVRKLLRGELEGERRAMISLPTGSGKTRVAVQAIVESMRDDGFRGGILWVADRDELCEQAVEAWRSVWRSEGAEDTGLRVSRMWDGQPPPLPTSEFHVIVATIQTLRAKLTNQAAAYAFLADFGLVVFDEAHRSIAPTFTSVMKEIGLTRFRRTDEMFLLGLTATPYRGRDEEDTRRLVKRYGSNRLDSGAFASDDPQVVIRQLQETEVLAKADHETIQGSTFSRETFAAEEWIELSKELKLDLPWLPRIVENRIAQDSERTRRIIKAYKRHVEPGWPTLIFATSVEHAQTLAALLSLKGIRSRAVSGQTETATRRRVVEEFRNGEVETLVNYSVFREGFDAPKTRAIIVARPVYSPNLYFQMIGRGLRGPRNGGGERCLILNVEDNIENYDRALAFSELDWLWD